MVETKKTRSAYKDYLHFGWKYLGYQRVKGGKGNHNAHVLQRDTSMPNYGEIVELEREYFALKLSLREYVPINGLICAICFSLLIIPCEIYVAFKSSQKKKIETSNLRIKEQMNRILAQVKGL